MTEDQERKIRIAILEAEARELHKMDWEKYAEQRKAKGLERNILTTKDLAKVIEHYFTVNTTGFVIVSFRAIYDLNKDKDKRTNGMEVDWVEKMSERRYGLDIFKDAFTTLNNLKELAPLFSSKLFKIENIINSNSITSGIKQMDTIVQQEILLVAKDEEIARLKAELATQYAKDWKLPATQMIKEGMKLKDVANKVGKSLATVKKLSASLKGK